MGDGRYLRRAGVEHRRRRADDTSTQPGRPRETKVVRLLLDTGVLDQICHPRKHHDVRSWFRRAVRDHEFLVSEVADCELRRELLRIGLPGWAPAEVDSPPGGLAPARRSQGRGRAVRRFAPRAGRPGIAAGHHWRHKRRGRPIEPGSRSRVAPASAIRPGAVVSGPWRAREGASARLAAARSRSRYDVRGLAARALRARSRSSQLAAPRAARATGIASAR